MINRAPKPKRGMRLACYEALEDGAASPQQIANSTGLTRGKVKTTLDNGVNQGVFVKAPNRDRYAIAPLSTYEHVRGKYNQYVREHYQKTKDAEGMPEKKADPNLKLAQRIAKKHNKTVPEVVRLALHYYNRNLHKRTRPVVRTKRGFWSRLFGGAS